MCIEDLALKCNDLGIKPSYNPNHDTIKQVESLNLNVNTENFDEGQLLSPRKALPMPPQNPEGLNEGINQLVASMRGHLNRKKHLHRVKCESFRKKVVNEILETELTYVSHLKILMEFFYEPLLTNSNSQKPMMSIEEFKSIFSSLDIIKSYNEQLLSNITPRIENWSPTQKIGDIFVEMAGFLKVYTNYVSNYSHAIQTLGICKKRERVRQFFEENEMKERTTIHSFNSILVMPVQRIPRYFILLKELEKHTWKDHIDYKDISTATEIMENVVSYMNEKTRDAENVAMVAEIQDRLNDINNLALPHRRFVESFDIKAHIKNKVRMLKLYFFNDIVIIVRSVKHSISLRAKKANKEKVEKVLSIKKVSIEFVDNAIHFNDADGHPIYSIVLEGNGRAESIISLFKSLKDQLSEKFERKNDDDCEIDTSQKKSWLNPLNILTSIKDTLTKEDEKKSPRSKDSETSNETQQKRKMKRSVTEKKMYVEPRTNENSSHGKVKSFTDMKTHETEKDDKKKRKFKSAKSDKNLLKDKR